MSVQRWITGMVGGLFVWGGVWLIAGLLLRNLFEGSQPLDFLVGFVVPCGLGLLAGAHSFKRPIRPRPRSDATDG
jgi:hypothetical protein